MADPIETAVKTDATSAVSSLKARVEALEAEAKSWYEKHLPIIMLVAGAAAGVLGGHIFWR
jgi:hypothetical protein